jgi:hypothetical protein
MDQDTPMNTPFGTTSGSDVGSGSGSTGGGSMGGGSGTGSSSGSGTGTTYNAGTGTSAGTGNCPHCGQSMSRGGLEQFLGRLGITDEMMGNLKSQFQNVDIDEYLNTARDYLKNGGEYLKSGSDKATTYAKDNPGKVAAGVATLALGAGLLYAALNRDRS